MAETNLTKQLIYHWPKTFDARTGAWPLTSSIYPILLITVTYLYLVLDIVPRFMKNRPPYELKTFIRCYNVFQIIANMWLVHNFLNSGWLTEFSVFCEPLDLSPVGRPYNLAVTMWWVVILKLIDLIETAIFVLRRKQNQVSFLHLYHHVSTVFYSWVFTRYVPGGMVSFFPLVNCSVHVIMYSYYFLSSFTNPSLVKILQKIKPLITIVQLVQFVIMLVYCIQEWSPTCTVRIIPTTIFVPNLIILFSLFANFYWKSYIKAKKEKSS